MILYTQAKRAFLVTTVAACACMAQNSSGITGTVTDPSGRSIPGVTVQIVNEDSGATASTQTNESGMYRTAPLQPGRYRLEAETSGFDKFVRRGITLAVSQTLALDLTLQLGKASETVYVEASEPLTETQSSNVAQLINRKMVSSLPMPNRAATSLVALAPGVVMIDPGSGAENYPLFSVAGGRARNQNFTLDGGSVNNAVGLTRPQQMTSLPVDAMQEFRVITNNYSAEFGHSTGGVVTLSTRSGTNQYHGSIFNFLRNDALDARNFFSAAKPDLRLQQLGATFGGPIRKDQTHFFVAWEQTRQATGATIIATVPTLAERTGDFSALVDAAGKPIQIYDPGTTVANDRQAFASNIIPQDRFDRVARAALAFWPLPDRTASLTGANNFGGNSNSLLHRDIVVGKLDHQIRPADTLTARYYINDSNTDNTGSYGIPIADPDAGSTDVRIQSILGAYTHVFRPNLIDELQVSFLQRKFIDQRYGLNSNPGAALGLTGVSGAAFPVFTLPGYASLGSSSVSRVQSPIRDTQIQDAVSWSVGSHAFKFGVEHRRGQNVEVRDRGSSGNFRITPLITGKPGVSGTGDSLASFLLGEVDAASVQVSDVIPSRAYYWAGYYQDDWRITQNLTVNLGLRYDVELPRRVDGDRMNSFDATAINPISGTPGVVTFAGRNGVPRQAFDPDWNNFGPRFGFAYKTPFLGNTVVRGGIGVFYGPTVSNSIGDAASTGFSTSASLVVSQAGLLSALELRNGFPTYSRPALDAGFGAAAPGQKPYTSVGFFERDRPTPISYQYNLNIQHEIAQNVVIEAGYLGNVSHHLTANDLSINQLPPRLMGAGDAQQLRPFPQFSDVYIINPAIGNSTYNAGYIKAEKRFSSGFSFLAHYTFSKFIDDVAAANEFGDPASYMDAYNRRLDKSLSGTDVPHRFIASVLYEMKSFKGRRFANIALGGWKVGVFSTSESGPPFTVVTAANTTNAFTAGPLRPNLTGKPELPGDQRSISRWFDTTAFSAPAPFTFGNSPRDGLRGPGLQTVDATLAKDFTLTERLGADIRAEFYNLLNHANFDIPGHTFGAADFGIISSAKQARAVQLGLRLSF